MFETYDRFLNPIVACPYEVSPYGSCDVYRCLEVCDHRPYISLRE